MKKIIISGVLISSVGAFLPEWIDFQMPSHPAFDEARVGFIRELRVNGFTDDKNVQIQIGNDSETLIMVQNLEDFKAKKEDSKIFLTMGTGMSKAVLSGLKNGQRLVYCSVTDPISSEIRGANITGVSNRVSAKDQLAFFKTLFPNVKKIGVLYNPKEINSISLIDEVREAAKALDIALVFATTDKASEVMSTAESLKGVDAFFVNNDNTFTSEWGDVVKVADQMGIPAFSSDSSLIPFGAVASFGADSEEVGKEAGAIVSSLLKGTSMEKLPPKNVSKPLRVINIAQLEKLKITISEEVLSKNVDRRWPERGWLANIFAKIQSFFKKS